MPTDELPERVRDEELDVQLAAGLVQARVWHLAQGLAADRGVPVRVALLAVREAVRRELELEARALVARAARQAEAAQLAQARAEARAQALAAARGQVTAPPEGPV